MSVIGLRASIRYVARADERRQRGVAYAFWLRLDQARVDQHKTQRDLVIATGIPASTINNLQWSTRPPQPRIVFALADALGIPHDEAKRLAGLAPPEASVDLPDVREAIRNDVRRGIFTEEQGRVLLDLVAAMDAANDAASPRRRSDSA